MNLVKKYINKIRYYSIDYSGIEHSLKGRSRIRGRAIRRAFNLHQACNILKQEFKYIEGLELTDIKEVILTEGWYFREPSTSLYNK